MAEADIDPGDTLNKKIRNAQLSYFNFILGDYNCYHFILEGNLKHILFILNVFLYLVIGEKERAAGTVNVRTRDNKVHGEMSRQELLENFKQLATSRSLSEDTLT